MILDIFEPLRKVFLGVAIITAASYILSIATSQAVHHHTGNDKKRLFIVSIIFLATSSVGFGCLMYFFGVVYPIGILGAGITLGTLATGSFLFNVMRMNAASDLEETSIRDIFHTIVSRMYPLMMGLLGLLYAIT